MQSELAEHTKLEGNIPAEMARVQLRGYYLVRRRSSGYSYKLTSCVALLVVVSQSSLDVHNGGGGGRTGREREVMTFIRLADRPRKNKQLAGLVPSAGSKSKSKSHANCKVEVIALGSIFLC